jgi:Sporulation and spore germination
LLGLVISNGLARVDLSSDYQNGASSRSLQLRLAQVVFTLTQFPTVRAVSFSVDGSPVTEHPVGRGAYKGLAPAASPLAGSWRLLPPAPIGAQPGGTAVWTGRELLVLGRRASAAYNPRTSSWRKFGPRPTAAVWTGKKLLTWGPSAPVSRPTIVAWTGQELIGWSRAGGAAYRPDTRRWRRLPAAPFLGSSAWTGHELIVVSGARAAAFVPGSGWRTLPPLPEARDGANLVWDGTELLVVGGNDAPAQGFAYDPKANSWRKLAPMDSGRARAATVWTGKRLLIWGGGTGRSGAFIPPHGLAYDPRADRWSPLPQAPLRGRADPLAVWTGRALIVWGGAGFADGAVFTPSG